jgi:small neutral amino acid transporter SnatA (MarC family)
MVDYEMRRKNRNSTSFHTSLKTFILIIVAVMNASYFLKLNISIGSMDL